jgi:thiol-disulfide isomerase/thioredoxin
MLIEIFKNMKKYSSYLSILLILLIITTLSFVEVKEKLQNGIWHAELTIIDGKKVPFLFELKNADTDSVTLTLLNGEERVPLNGIYHRSDTVFIPITAYDAVIKATISGDSLNGRFIKNYIEHDKGIPFKAVWNNTLRFKPEVNPTQISIDGRWDIFFIGKNDSIRNVGVFKTENKIVTGSVLTNLGDLRFLEGTLTKKGVKLSAFSGLSPLLIDIDFIDNDTFEGNFYTVQGKVKLYGKRNNKAVLDDAYSLTSLKKDFERLHFQLPDADGNVVSLDDERYKNKIVIVSILGSWCPNCLDEASFLAPWYKENKNRGVEIVGLAFERKDDFDYGKNAIIRLKKDYGITYEILFAGKASPASIAKVLPEIENFSSYPTTIFIDKKGKVRKIYTGYSGPATGVFYDEFKEDFNSLINSLVNESL